MTGCVVGLSEKCSRSMRVVNEGLIGEILRCVSVLTAIPFFLLRLCLQPVNIADPGVDLFLPIQPAFRRESSVSSFQGRRCLL